MKIVIYFLLILFVFLGGCSQRKEQRMIPVKKDIRINPFGRYSSTFNDMNDVHLSSAMSLGINPIHSREEAFDLGEALCQIEDCDYYSIDSLSHSIPFLVPKARDLLDTIGRNFIDSLQSRGGGSYKIIVTSVLRAENDISRLRKKNSNASSNSAHRFGSTFDIAYSRFQRTDNRYTVADAQLKHLLAEVLLALRKQNKCYIRYEIKQGCFHITAR